MLKPTRGVYRRKNRVLQRKNVLEVHFVYIAKRCYWSHENSNTSGVSPFVQADKMIDKTERMFYYQIKRTYVLKMEDDNGKR